MTVPYLPPVFSFFGTIKILIHLSRYFPVKMKRSHIGVYQKINKTPSYVRCIELIIIQRQELGLVPK